MSLHMKAIPIAGAAALAALLSGSAVGKEDSKEFLAKAIEGDASEVLLGQLAEQKAGSQEVRDFGRRLATEHGAHKEKAAALAQTVGVPPSSSAASKDAQNEHDKLSKLSGADFDKEFVAYMVKDHKDDIHEYTEASKAKDNAQVAEFAKNTIPALQRHLDLAQDLEKRVKK